MGAHVKRAKFEPVPNAWWGVGLVWNQAHLFWGTEQESACGLSSRGACGTVVPWPAGPSMPARPCRVCADHWAAMHGGGGQYAAGKLDLCRAGLHNMATSAIFSAFGRRCGPCLRAAQRRRYGRAEVR